MKDLNSYTVFTKWYTLLNYFLDRIEKFPRDAKFTVGDRICKIILDVQELIIESIYSKEKIEKLKKINIYLEQLRIYSRISFERKYISSSQYQYIFTELNEVGKIIGGWINSCKE